LIRPKISIPFAASQVHGLYDRDLVDKPYIEDSIDRILKVLNSADVVAGHNIEYDETVLGYELARMKRVGEYTPMKSICTMRSSTDYCKLQGR
jgi:DNA polymerase III epsilon subunit-like protein